MTDTQTMVRTTISFGGENFLLAQAPDYEDLKGRITAAVRAGGDFVDFVIVGNRPVSVFVTGRDRIVLGTETIPRDERDTGDTDFPFGTFYDAI